MKNGPHLSRLLDPPGIKVGRRRIFSPRPAKTPFGPGWCLHPGQKGVLAGRGENAPVAHLQSRVDLINGTNEARFSFWHQNFGLSAFFHFFFICYFKMGYQLLIAQKKILSQKIIKKSFYTNLDSICPTKILHFI